MFMHGGLLHLGGNMLFLWIFGNNVEDSHGPGEVPRLLPARRAGGDGAADRSSTPTRRSRTSARPGRSRRVLGGYLLLFPRARVITVIFIIFFFTIVELPALIFLVIWFAQQVAVRLLRPQRAGGDGGGVAYFAHIGGFAFGLLAIKLFASNTGDGGRSNG